MKIIKKCLKKYLKKDICIQKNKKLLMSCDYENDKGIPKEILKERCASGRKTEIIDNLWSIIIA